MMMEGQNTTLLKKNKPLKYLNRIVKRPTLSIEFQDVNYFVKERGESKKILNSVSGKFCCGEFTAILGPSGAGKTTLLNVLAGYAIKGVQGNISVNNNPRDLSLFRKISSYIMQENITQPNLSVMEAMIYAAKLKLGSNIKQSDQMAVIKEIINFLGMEECVDTRSEHLSGGQRKRLTVALELVNNPAVIFLDEPTTGLDDFASKQCIDLLKKISKLDRTVICTIHQPSSLIFHCFDQVYVVADGCCVYNGSPNQLVPFFPLSGHCCPSNYDPADYIVELVHSSPSVVDSLKNIIQNGKINMKDSNVGKFERGEISKNDTDFPISSLEQLWFLMSRIFMQIRRNKLSSGLRLFCHLLIGFTMGSLYSGIGRNAFHIITIFKLCHGTNIFFSFFYSIVPVLLFPGDIPLVKREHFNRWYGLKIYYLALTIVNVLPLILFGTIFVVIVYFMTDQPMQIDRFMGFYLMNLTIGLTSQAMGFVIGCIFDRAAGTVVHIAVFGYMLMLTVYGLGFYLVMHPLVELLTKTSYMRFGAIGVCRALAYEREPLKCLTDFCGVNRLQDIFRKQNVPLYHYSYDLGYLLVFFCVFQVQGYLALKYRFDVEFSSRVAGFFQKVIKLKK